MTCRDWIKVPRSTPFWHNTWTRRKLLLLLTVLLGLSMVWLSGMVDRPLDQMLDSRRDYHEALMMGLDGPPDFVATATQKRLPQRAPPGASLGLRIWVAYFNLKTRLGIRNPAGTIMEASTNQEWLVFRLLEQATEITGKRYLVAREGMNRRVSFGSSIRLSGVAWAAEIEKTLGANGWVLSKGVRGAVTVVPRDKLEDYHKAGMVKTEN